MAACPDEATLLALVEGKLARLVARPLQRHIDVCRSCQLASAEAARTAIATPGGEAPAPKRAVGRGTKLAGRFVLERAIGQGGTGAVWSAQRIGSGERVAIKLLHDARPDCVRRLEREARLAAQVAHPALVHVHEVLSAEQDGPALVMELLRGEDLSAYLERQTALSVRALAEILAPVVAAIAALHARQIAHRDLKPANLFLARSEDGMEHTRVLDLGMARSLDLELCTLNASRLTSANTVLGTPRYMAPEQLDGARDVDVRADIWALGAIAYRMLSGRPHVAAFRYVDVLRALHSAPITPLTSLVADVPTELGALVNQSLSMAPAARPSASAWSTVLSRWLVPAHEGARDGDA